VTDLRAIVDRARDGVPCSVVVVTADRIDAVSAGESADEPQFIGSVTKIITATAVLRMVSLGRLALDDLVSSRVPGYDTPGVTLRQLLAHRAGGSFEYSNDGYRVLGEAVARAAGLPAAKAIHDHVLMRMDMVRSTFPTPALRPPDLPVSEFASGGLRATARELAKFGRAHLHEPAFAAMQERHGDAGELADGMGLGWMIDDFDGTTVLLHGGHVAGRSAILAAIPSLGASLAVLCGPEREAGVIWGAVMRQRLGLIQRR
jgi:CubicO group peptidase (beta-lactamase class C family)